MVRFDPARLEFRHRSLRCASAVLCLTLSAGAACAFGPDGVQPQIKSILAPGRAITGVVVNGQATRSRLLQYEPDALRGAVPTIYEIGARVIVDGELHEVRRAAGPGVRLRRAATKGFVLVETDTVDHAIELANRLAQHPLFGSVEVDLQPPRAERSPSDPAFFVQWPLRNNDNANADVNAVDAWDLGFTGAGVTVGVIELGWQVDHPDLAANFASDASMPPSIVTTHATQVAGVIAADNDNGQGGVGIAYDAGLSRLIYGLASDTANAFLFRNDLNDIKNNSWGPTDNGRITVMSAIEHAALVEGVTLGRGGLGEIYVWAAGNGGLDDRVDYDPYASSRYTIAIGAIGNLNMRADYNEIGSSMFAVTYSDGNELGVFTTSNNNGYSSNFGGTSASAPLAAGMIALMLDANPNLSWRDVQHIIADTAWQVDLASEGWAVNGDGRNISEDFGLGALDAHALVVAAQGWTSVADEVIADSGVVSVSQTIPDDDFAGITVTIPVTDQVKLESVELRLNVDTDYVGDLQITLVSPSGTTSVFTTSRVDPTDDLVDHIFTTVRSWGEDAAGLWTVNIADRRATNIADWVDARIIGYGTATTGGCAVDLTGDGIADFGDVQAFLSAYHTQDPIADFNADGQFDYFDLQVFLNLFSAGCP